MLQNGLNDRARNNISLLDSLVQGTSALVKSGITDSPSSIICYPIALGNPFQKMLYKQAIPNGFFVTGTNNLEELSEINWPWPVYLHIHWLGDVLRGVESEFVASSRINTFVTQLKNFVENGGRIIWTVHNILPHDSILSLSEMKLRTEVSNLCHSFHIMNRETPELAAQFFRIPRERCFFTPHPSYEGFYPRTVSREEARIQLGIESDVFVFLFFGSIQHYKGLDDLVAAYQKVKGQFSTITRLIVAGQPSNPSEHQHTIEMANSDENIDLHIRRIALEDVQIFFEASDVCACPYRKTLNSGITLLSHTFSTPVIGPDTAAFKETIGKEGGLLFEYGNFDSLCEKLVSSTEYPIKMQREWIIENIKSLNCHTISEIFFDKLASTGED